jgi:hypothetical protein
MARDKSETLTLEHIRRAREIMDAHSVPAPDMYLNTLTGQWFRREGNEWVEIPEINLGSLPSGE